MFRESGSPLPILVGGDERLRARAAPVSGLDGSVLGAMASLCSTLGEFRRRQGFGRALAAPQVGIGQRLIAVDLGAGPFVLANPEIVWRSPETFELWDDCFSLPDLLVRVARHRSVSVVFHDERFRRRTWELLPPDLSELLQHEIDHLDGVLMTDRAVGPDAVKPVSERATLVDAARPSRRISLDAIAEAARTVDPVFLGTPQYECAPLSRELGAALTLKVETVNPIRCFKGRGADAFVRRTVARGASGPMVCASAGNFGQALAWACRASGIPLVVYAAAGANALKVERMRALGADVRLEGADLDAAKAAARAFADSSSARMVEDGREREITEGAGSIAVELLARDEVFDDLLVPLGNGALLNGVARWVKAVSPATRVTGVASAGARAMADSWRRGPAEPIVSYERVETIADGIAVREPIPEAVADMHGLVDDVVLVDDPSLVAAMRLVHRHAGLVTEPAGAAGVAALLADRGRFAGRRVATVLCGGNVSEDGLRAWLGAP